MRKLLAVLLCICISLAWAGCTAPATNDPAATTVPSDPSSPSEPDEPSAPRQPMHAISMVTVKEDTQAQDGTVIFTQSYQRIRLNLGQSTAAQSIENDLQKKISTALSNAAELESIAQDDYSGQSGWTPYFTDIRYTPTRIDQSVLSLFSNYSSHSGGNHPALVTQSVTYDLSTGQVLKLDDILTDNCTNSQLIELVNQALSPSSEDLWYDYETTVTDHFSAKLGSITNWYFSRTGLCFHFAPFMIAPYSSGTIIAAISYEQLDGIVQQKYLPADQPAATGSMYVEEYDDSEPQLTDLAQLELSSNGTAVLLHPDATVNDVRIETGTWSSDGLRYIPFSTVFAADSMDTSSGILLTADLSSNNTVLRLIYHSGGQEVTAFIGYDETGKAVVLSNG